VAGVVGGTVTSAQLARSATARRMKVSGQTSTYTLVVRGPAEDLLYARFARLFAGREDVLVVRDRRRSERRRVAAPVVHDRRDRDRRGLGRPWLVPPD
jgi:hypothetical protein